MEKEKEYTVPSMMISVRKSNTLIRSLGNATLLSNKVFLTALLKIELRCKKEEISTAEREYYKKLKQKTGADFSDGLVAEFSNVELRHVMKSNSGSYYKFITELMDISNPNSLRNQWIIMAKEDGIYGVTDVITSTVYDTENGKLFIKFSSEETVQNELYNLKSNYTLLNYGLMMSFKSIYTYRIYELLMSRIGYQDGTTGTKQMEYSFTYGISELKFLLGILDPYVNAEVSTALRAPNPDYQRIEESLGPNKNMPRFSQFKTYALDKAKIEICKCTDFEFDYNPVRGGRGGKVMFVDMIMRRKSNTSIEKEETDKIKNLTPEEKDSVLDELSDMLPCALKIKEMRTIAETAGYDINKLKKAVEVLTMSSGDIENTVGFLINAIRGDYELPTKTQAEEKQKKNSWNSFEQRNYNYDELEKGLLNANTHN